MLGLVLKQVEPGLAVVFLDFLDFVVLRLRSKGVEAFPAEVQRHTIEVVRVVLMHIAF